MKSGAATGGIRSWWNVPAMIVWCGCLSAAITGAAESLALPPRSPEAIAGSEFAGRISSGTLQERDEQIRSEVVSGNVPGWLRDFVPVELRQGTNRATIRVLPDYLAIGSDQDYLLVPMMPATAQAIADLTGCSLPTRKIVDEVHSAAPVKLEPSPMKPGKEMTTVAWFSNHNQIVAQQRNQQAQRAGTITAGHKKDVVITPRLTNSPGKIAIYGWHKRDGKPIQPLYLGHTERWVDYSQCVRLISQRMLLNGAETTVSNVLATPGVCDLLSDEGVITFPRYQTSVSGPPQARAERIELELDWREGPRGERFSWASIEPGVRIYANVPAQSHEHTNAPWVVFYALPNGNTIEQTLGKVRSAADDWRYDIQHVLAQARFVREALQDRTIAVVCLETDQRSWPAWRKKHGDERIPDLLHAVTEPLQLTNAEWVLTGHSGGGSLTFGYLNTVRHIPAEVVRIALLDSNYGYGREPGHAEKLVEWLQDSDRHFLSVFAYNDAVALLHGTNFVSAAGGTWGRSSAMLRDLQKSFDFKTGGSEDLRSFSALNGRVQFFLKENPGKEILHTVQVEKNGLIHALLTGTKSEGKGYRYFGPRAYGEWISSD